MSSHRRSLPGRNEWVYDSGAGCQRHRRSQMRGVLRALAILQALLPIGAFAADQKVLVELNSIEPADNRCRLNFVIENKSDVAIESMKLDLVTFGTDGAILRRLLTEMGPVRTAKTMVRAFVVDDECRQIGAILVNDVAA